MFNNISKREERKFEIIGCRYNTLWGQILCDTAPIVSPDIFKCFITLQLKTKKIKDQNVRTSVNFNKYELKNQICGSRFWFLSESAQPFWPTLSGFVPDWPKGQTNSKYFFQADISSKKRTHKFDFTTFRLVFIRFLEESEDNKKTIRN